MSNRSNAIIEINDADRNIDMTLSVNYDWLPEGAVENPTVEVIRACAWFGKYAADLDLGDNAKGIAREIETKYAEEIAAAVLDVREVVGCEE